MCHYAWLPSSFKDALLFCQCNETMAQEVAYQTSQVLLWLRLPHGPEPSELVCGRNAGEFEAVT